MENRQTKEHVLEVVRAHQTRRELEVALRCGDRGPKAIHAELGFAREKVGPAIAFRRRTKDGTRRPPCELCAECVVDVDARDGWSQVAKEFLFRVSVVFHGAMEVQVILSEIGKRRHAESNGGHA